MRMLILPKTALLIALASIFLTSGRAVAGSVVSDMAERYPCVAGGQTLSVRFDFLESPGLVVPQSRIDERLTITVNEARAGHADPVVEVFEYFSACNLADEAGGSPQRLSTLAARTLFKADCLAIRFMRSEGLMDIKEFFILLDFYQEQIGEAEYFDVSYRERTDNLRKCAPF